MYDVRFTVCHACVCVCVCVGTCTLHKYMRACIVHACSYVHAYAYEMHLGSISRFSLQYVICRRELCINIPSVQIYETGRKKKGLEHRENARLIFARLCMRGRSFIWKLRIQMDSYIQEIYTRNMYIYIFKFIKHLANNL